MPDLSLAGGKVLYEVDDAKAVIAGYAFGTTEVLWNDGRWKPEVNEGLKRPLFSYWSYDAVPADRGDLSYRDVLITSGIESRIYGRPAAQVMAVAPEVSKCLRKLKTAEPFWALPYEDLGRKRPSSDSDAWWIWEAWGLLHYLKWSGRATAHKILHHKDPKHFPLVDSVISKCYRYSVDGQWAGIHRDLSDHVGQYTDLEDWFAEVAKKIPSAVPLQRLRLHDILVWCDRTTPEGSKEPNRIVAARKGREIQKPI